MGIDDKRQWITMLLFNENQEVKRYPEDIHASLQFMPMEDMFMLPDNTNDDTMIDTLIKES